MATTQELSSLRRLIVERTKAFAILNGYVKKDKVLRISPKNKEISIILGKKVFGCKQEVATKLISALVGFDFSEHVVGGVRDDRNYKHLFSAVVPLEAKEGHSYTLNEVVVIVSSDADGSNGVGMRINGMVGNFLPRGHKTFIRPATEEEMSGIPQSQLEGVISQASMCFLTA